MFDYSSPHKSRNHIFKNKVRSDGIIAGSGFNAQAAKEILVFSAVTVLRGSSLTSPEFPRLIIKVSQAIKDNR